MERVVVIGSSCSGKSTFSQKLANKMALEYIELDQLHWLPNWQERADDEFRGLVKQATASDTWVLDGNYSVVRDIVWPRATKIIWLNHSFSLVLYRSFTRSIVRAVTKKKLFAGNVETFKQTFFSRDSIILWVLQTYHQKRKRYNKLLPQLKFQGIEIIELNNQKQVQQYLKNI
ncbi:MAG: adenylate kinase [Colwellia sp.]|uniref:adenylate kinase n=1 Tax=Colwellia sp. TaxID=56799 RepID=UPI0025C69B6C|nr:adenylate kinase [Colwellia sp.]NQZ28683.1 adenylate kinase [Colwellia sp.]